MLKSNKKATYDEMLSQIKSEAKNQTDNESGAEDCQDDQNTMEVDVINPAIKSSSSISSSSSVSDSSISPKNQLHKLYDDEDDLPIDLSAKKSRLNSYYSATVT